MKVRFVIHAAVLVACGGTCVYASENIDINLRSATAVGPLAIANQSRDEASCVYVVQRGDNLTRILLKLGLAPIYGSQGNLRSLIESNPGVVKNEGDLIHPNVRLRIPRSLVGRTESCVDPREELDIQRKMALYSEAEAELRAVEDASVCNRIIQLASLDKRFRFKERYLHLAAICYYEQGGHKKAHELWVQVLAHDPEDALRYRALYNLALVECQKSGAEVGYERLRSIPLELWAAQGPYEQRSFLELAAFCAERGVGARARVKLLVHLLQRAPEEQLRLYAAERLRADFADSSRCDVTEGAVKLLEDRADSDGWRGLWSLHCQPDGSRAPQSDQLAEKLAMEQRSAQAERLASEIKVLEQTRQNQKDEFLQELIDREQVRRAEDQRRREELERAEKLWREGQERRAELAFQAEELRKTGAVPGAKLPSHLGGDDEERAANGLFGLGLNYVFPRVTYQYAVSRQISIGLALMLIEYAYGNESSMRGFGGMLTLDYHHRKFEGFWIHFGMGQHHLRLRTGGQITSLSVPTLMHHYGWRWRWGSAAHFAFGVGAHYMHTPSLGPEFQTIRFLPSLAVEIGF